MSMLKRRQFHALVAAGAGTCLIGCSSSASGTVTPTDGQVVLPLSQFPALGAAGGSAVIDVSGSFPLIVVRTSASAATALSATCTHAACLVEYSAGAEQIVCNCHHASFSLEGAVLGGPTSTPLPVYAATVGADAITVSLS
jgi:cytochrome b6-f complex iron-sulfur subunit